MDHHFNGDTRRIRVAEDDHAERIAHQQQIDAAFIEKSSRRIIVGGEHRELFAARLHQAELLNPAVVRVHCCHCLS